MALSFQDNTTPFRCREGEIVGEEETEEGSNRNSDGDGMEQCISGCSSSSSIVERVAAEN